MFFSTSVVRGGVLALALSLAGAAANAAGSVAWLSPANGSSFPVGTSVSPTGQASASGTVGGGLDLVLVLDASGSMQAFVSGLGVTRAELQKQAATALVDNLPAGTNVSVVSFAETADVDLSLTPLPSGAVTTAINNVRDDGFSTMIDLGIDAAVAELAANGTTGASQQILVISDGDSFGSRTPAAAAADALAAGITVNTIGFPGISTTGADALQATAAAGNGTFVNFSNNPQDIVDIFSGAGGGVLVGVSGVQITDPDGTTYAASVDALGNFTANAFNLKQGANMFTALATFTDGTTASSKLTLVGLPGNGTSPVPLPASALLLLGGLGALGALRRRRKA